LACSQSKPSSIFKPGVFVLADWRGRELFANGERIFTTVPICGVTLHLSIRAITGCLTPPGSSGFLTDYSDSQIIPIQV
jgi:hypothetical protein